MIDRLTAGTGTPAAQPGHDLLQRQLVVQDRVQGHALLGQQGVQSLRLGFRAGEAIEQESAAAGAGIRRVPAQWTQLDCRQPVRPGAWPPGRPSGPDLARPGTGPPGRRRPWTGDRTRRFGRGVPLASPCPRQAAPGEQAGRGDSGTEAGAYTRRRLGTTALDLVVYSWPCPSLRAAIRMQRTTAPSDLPTIHAAASREQGSCQGLVRKLPFGNEDGLTAR